MKNGSKKKKNRVTRGHVYSQKKMKNGSEFKFAYPTARRAFVCSIDEKLSEEMQKEIATHILNQSSGLTTELLSCIASQETNFKNPILEGGENVPELVRDEGFVVKFPKYRISWNKLAILSRSSMTVCSHRNNSKVWTRLTLYGSDESPATSLGYTLTANFLHESALLSAVILQKLQEQYNSILEMFNANRGFRQSYDVFIKTVGTRSSDIRQIFTGIILYEYGNLKDILGDEVAAESMKDFFKLVSFFPGKQEHSKKRNGGESYESWSYLRDTSYGGLYLTRATTMGVNLEGLVYEPDNLSPRGIHALQSSAVAAKTYGALY